MPSFWLDYDNYETSLSELSKREYENNVDILVSKIIDEHKSVKLMITINHPNTFLFLEIVKQICVKLGISFFTTGEYSHFMKNNNFMNLPTR